MATCPSCGHKFHTGRGRKPEPDVFIVCGCGCSWKGRSAVNNPIIDHHRNRERSGVPQEGRSQCHVVVIRDNRLGVVVGGAEPTSDLDTASSASDGLDRTSGAK